MSLGSKMELAYWKCPTTRPSTDAIFVINTCLSCVSLLLNLSVFILLCILTDKTRTFLVHLRTLTASTTLCSFFGFCLHVIPSRDLQHSPTFGGIVCHVWSSRYIFEVAYVFNSLNLNFMVGSRAIQIAGKYQNSFAPSLFSDLTYVILIGLGSIISVLSQVFLVEWNGRYCSCNDTGLQYWVLVAAYVGSFVRFGLAAVISPIILCVSCYKIVQWVRSTPEDKLSDTWNDLVLPGTTDGQLRELHRPHGWVTASMCTVPMSANFVAFSMYNTIYSFTAAVGLHTLVLDSVSYRMGALFVYIQLLFSPVIIVIYIPVFRALFVQICKWPISKLLNEAQHLTQNGSEAL